ncbi:hypothetical protein PYCCODRAFT_1474837 [Trametes coccinea BRFM310]|uniref:Uncharacterized protein n=1 Tax=Trametes coccinea (strain BRFM310) TaxID=1353009 RepID=A0A1Y2IXT8_TRAC3|nr:hypothetical protein PYCCODRAFT_1474837 [Trametes coccinea BRFM310]
MRSPVIAFSIIAAAVSPTLVSGAPASPKLDNAIAHTTDAVSTHQLRDTVPAMPAPVGGSGASGALPLGALLGQAPTNAQPNRQNQDDPVHRTQAMKKAKEQAMQGGQSSVPKAPAVPAVAHKAKRAGDAGTAGGNAYSGAASSSSGGAVVNEASDGTLTNDAGANAAGGGGSSFSGFSFGGTGNGHGPGGNAYSGATGDSRGGDVVNVDQDSADAAAGGGGGDVTAIDNAGTTGNDAGGGGFSESGSAEGGDARGPPIPQSVQGFEKRAGDAGTAGGNAYSGATSDVSGGSVVNAADDRGAVANGGGNVAGGAGTTFSGDADGGNGNGLGPGGNAYTGASGPADGGSVYNFGGTIDNAADSNAAGGGGVSETGDATGGRA